MRAVLDRRFKLTRVTKPPLHHFFGYYDKSPWSMDEQYILCLETEFMERPPRPEDKAAICLIDAEELGLRRLAYTSAWNWQQGCMLQWLPGKEDRTIIYNDRVEDRFVSVVINVDTGDRWTLPSPIYTLSPDGRYALSLNFARLNDTRPGYGYCGIRDPWYGEKAPEKDGIYLVDLRGGSCDLIVSLAEIASFSPQPSFQGAKHWFNHLLFNPSGDRFVFLHRWSRPGGRRMTRMFTADKNGDDICCLVDSGLVSHFDWLDNRHVLAWCLVPERGEGFFLVEDLTGSAEPVGEGVLTVDGHCSFSPDRRWILTDTYPDAQGYRRLMMCRVETGELIVIGRFYSLPKLQGEIRCDLHPRWSRDGGKVCVDSTHEGSRQMYVIDVSSVAKAGQLVA